MKINVQSSPDVKKRNAPRKGKQKQLNLGADSAAEFKAEEAIHEGEQEPVNPKDSGVEVSSEQSVEETTAADTLKEERDDIFAEELAPKKEPKKKGGLGLHKAEKKKKVRPTAEEVEAEIVEELTPEFEEFNTSMTLSFVLACVCVIVGAGALGFAFGGQVAELLQGVGVL